MDYDHRDAYVVSDAKLHEAANLLEVLAMLHHLAATDSDSTERIREYMNDCDHCIRELGKLIHAIATEANKLSAA